MSEKALPDQEIQYFCLLLIFTFFFASVLKKQAHSEFTSDIGHEVWPPSILETKIDGP